MKSFILGDVLNISKNDPPDQQEQQVWKELTELDCQVHQSQAYQCELKAFAAIALALSINELGTVPTGAQNLVWLQQLQIACRPTQHRYGLCQITNYQKLSNLLQANAMRSNN